MDAVGLPQRGGVGALRPAVEPVGVALPLGEGGLGPAERAPGLARIARGRWASPSMRTSSTARAFGAQTLQRTRPVGLGHRPEAAERAAAPGLGRPV